MKLQVACESAANKSAEQRALNALYFKWTLFIALICRYYSVMLVQIDISGVPAMSDASRSAEALVDSAATDGLELHACVEADLLPAVESQRAWPSISRNSHPLLTISIYMYIDMYIYMLRDLLVCTCTYMCIPTVFEPLLHYTAGQLACEL